jgi:hypothetical protein
MTVISNVHSQMSHGLDLSQYGCLPAVVFAEFIATEALLRYSHIRSSPSWLNGNENISPKDKAADSFGR